MPFYVALPQSTIDWTIADGVRDIPIEERSAARGHAYDRACRKRRDRHRAGDGRRQPRRQPGFDVTPARLVTGLMTERGVAPATREGLAQLYPGLAAKAAAAAPPGSLTDFRY